MKRHVKRIGLLALLLACTLAALPSGAYAAGNGGEAVLEASGTWDDATQSSDGHFIMAVPKSGETAGSRSRDVMQPAQPEISGTRIVIDGEGARLVMESEDAKPEYTVEYYARLPVVVKSEYGGDLAVIDTSAADDAGPRLPVNGDRFSPGTSLTNLMLDQDGKVMTEEEFRCIYADETWEYQDAPQTVYIDKVSSVSETNYSLAEIWVLREGGDPSEGIFPDGYVDDDAVRRNWDVYTQDDIMRSQGAYAGRMGIEPTPIEPTPIGPTPVDPSDLKFECPVPGSVIRLVYEPLRLSGDIDDPDSDRTRDIPATFYDYDITDDGVMTGNSYDKGRGYGINSLWNYETSGAAFAFGNANSGTGMWLEEWSGNKLNMSNGNSYGGCTFGLADSLLPDGTIRYSDGVRVQKLFNEEGRVDGKTAYPDGSLTFRQVGDTYTLLAASIDGSDDMRIRDLDVFTNPQGSIRTNSFWPMDGVHNRDPHTGGRKIRFSGWVRGTNNSIAKYEWASTSSSYAHNVYPDSDDRKAHNNLFGLYYTVDFELTADYRGPLDYLFFGDDDMWVFLSPLDTDADGNVGLAGPGRLVCDIGGVHRSVGEYVDLWDWIGTDQDGAPLPGKYRLSIFYTERGLSGSTCYTQFTLPRVSRLVPSTPDQPTAALSVSKQVGTVEEASGGSWSLTDDEAYDGSRKFEFMIAFQDAYGKPLDMSSTSYPYTVTDADGIEIERDVLAGMRLNAIQPGSISDIYTADCAGCRVSLGRGDTVTVSNLPEGAKYAITESRCDGYIPNALTGGRLSPDGFVQDESGGNASFTAGSGTAKGILSGDVSVTYINEPVSYALPKTGGSGSAPYAIGGIAAVSLGIGGPLLVGRKRKHEDDEDQPRE